MTFLYTKNVFISKPIDFTVTRAKKKRISKNVNIKISVSINFKLSLWLQTKENLRQKKSDSRLKFVRAHRFLNIVNRGESLILLKKKQKKIVDGGLYSAGIKFLKFPSYMLRKVAFQEIRRPPSCSWLSSQGSQY